MYTVEWVKCELFRTDDGELEVDGTYHMWDDEVTDLSEPTLIDLLKRRRALPAFCNPDRMDTSIRGGAEEGKSGYIVVDCLETNGRIGYINYKEKEQSYVHS